MFRQARMRDPHNEAERHVDFLKRTLLERHVCFTQALAHKKALCALHLKLARYFW
jgi:hypothetical protein